jgi:hypothetical protein
LVSYFFLMRNYYKGILFLFCHYNGVWLRHYFFFCQSMYFHNFNLKSIYIDILILFLCGGPKYTSYLSGNYDSFTNWDEKLPMSLFSLYLVYITMTSFFLIFHRVRKILVLWVAKKLRVTISWGWVETKFIERKSKKEILKKNFLLLFHLSTKRDLDK